MTRFQMELSGHLGEFWRKNAEKEIAEMQAKADNGEIILDEQGGAMWAKVKRYLPSDCAEKLSHTTFTFSLEATEAGRDAQIASFLANYTHRTTEEERIEMRAAFGTGTTVVNILSGERIRL